MRKIISFLMMAVFSASLFAATYTVAGSSAAAFGSSWDPTNTANDMTLVDGVYTFVKEDVTLPAGTLEFKVCLNHAWTTCWPSGDNAMLVISEAGKYTLTFTFVESTGNVSVSAQKTEDAQVDPKVSIKGAWDSWAEALEFNLAEDKKSASYVMAVATAASYEFKVIVGDDGWRSDEHIFTRDDASTTGMTGNSNTNLKLVADVAGNYTFTWTFATNALVVTFPEKGDDPTPPTPAEKDSIYFVNAQGWAAPKVHLWGGTADATAWPGVEMAKEAEKINNYDVYKFVADKGAYLSCIFNNSGAEGEQTADLAWTSGKYFYEDAWYAKENIPVPGAPVDSATIYYVNAQDWTIVQAFVWLEGSGSYKAWPGEEMTKTAAKALEKDVYSYTFPSKYTSIIFNNGNSGEGNQTSDEVAAWDAAKPYFYDGKWYASLEDIPAVEPETPAKYYLAGTMNEWNIGANEFVGEGDTLRLSVALEADSVYKYKVVKVAGDTTWYGTSYAEIMEYGNSTDWHLDGNEDAGLHTTKAANYEFIYIPKDNNRIDVIIPAPKEYTYTITGDSLLMGSDWDPEDVTNDMVYDAEAGVYKLEKKNVPLGVHLYSYPYKVVRDHAWGEGQYPETGDYFINVKEPGMYTLTFTYEPANQILNAYAQKTADMEKDVTIYFVKKEAWDTVYAYFWIDQTDVGYILWPGEKMTLTDKVLNDVANDTAYAVYSYSFPSMFTKIIFNNGEGGTGNQTADMSWSTAKPYYYDGAWYESLEAINPAAETKFYITGNVALVGAGNPWDPKAIKSMEDSYTLDLKAGTYEMLLYLDGTTATMKGYDDLTAKTPGLTSSGDAIRFRLKEAGQVVVTYKEVDATVTFTVTGSFYTVEDGYYLAGQGMWTGLDLYAYRKFVANESKPGEYVSNEITLYENDYIQAVKVVDNAIDQWYADTYYTVDANHAGVKVVYFSPDYNEAWAEFGGYMYIAPNELTAIDNAAAEGKAVKMIKNGMLIIEKGGKLYNVMGIQIR